MSGGIVYTIQRISGRHKERNTMAQELNFDAFVDFARARDAAGGQKAAARADVD